ncbi:MAG TPA: HlyD family efflux transporter periplasmic adaptor subunit [Pseudonocardia sp.]|nr:HlyD family efflux transporter periplasmic adaptor subunit [Pseudonocardia sp.]
MGLAGLGLSGLSGAFKRRTEGLRNAVKGSPLSGSGREKPVVDQTPEHSYDEAGSLFAEHSRERSYEQPREPRPTYLDEPREQSYPEAAPSRPAQGRGRSLGRIGGGAREDDTRGDVYEDDTREQPFAEQGRGRAASRSSRNRALAAEDRRRPRGRNARNAALAGAAAAGGAALGGALAAQDRDSGRGRRGRSSIADTFRNAPVTQALMGSAIGSTVRDAVGPDAPRWHRPVVGASLLVPLCVVAVACGNQAATPTTAKVTRASISSKVTGTGALRAISEQNLGFDKGGKITKVNVTVGQQVTAGQILAQIDDFEARAGVRKAQAALDREEATLAGLEDEEKVDATKEDYKGADDVLDATTTQSKKIDDSNDKAVDSAERQISIARDALRSAQMENQADSVRCQKSIGGDSRRKPGEVHQPGGLKGELFVPAPIESSACDRARRSDQQVDDARSKLADATAQAESARQKRNVDHAQQQIAIANAKRDSRAAKFAAKDAKKARPHDLAAQEAVVADAQADLDLANRDVENTVLRAPVDGKVAAINGAVGEYLSGGSGTTPLSPGSRVSLPDVSSGVGSSDSSDSKADRPGGNSFMVLDDINTFQVVVPFEESDAAKIQPNQRVDVTFDSVPDLTRQGTVVAISPTGTQIQDVTNYYVTVVLNELDPRLKDGQTAQANVVTGEVDNVLVVPSSAVQQAGSTGVVTVVDPDGKQRQVQVQLGMTGDNMVQVLSGLRMGQTVVVPDST